MNQWYQNADEKWAQLHEHLQDLLAGYADDELDDQQVMVVEAHLLGCEACRNDLARQQLLSQRLETIPPPRMTAAQHQRIDQKLKENSAKPRHARRRLRWQLPLSLTHWTHHFRLPAVASAGGWVLALALAVVILAPSLKRVEHNKIPMIHDALTEYYEMEGKALPVENRNASLKAPVHWSNAHVLATWKTTVAGAPAQAFALRSGQHIVFQYQIDESVFFRNPVVRQAVAKSGNYKTRSNKTDVLALPLSHSGVLVVGPADSLPEPDQLKFGTT